MVKLYKGGAYLLHGTEVIADAPDALAAVKSKTGIETTKEAAAKETMAYGILSAHNTSGNMQQLQIKFDKLTSHDITFVGIIQTARASGLEKFPIPYVLTNCHNSLCAVGGTINEDDHMFGLTCAKKYGGVYVPPHQAVIHQFAREMLAGGGKMILGSDSHTRYGALGTMAMGEGGICFDAMDLREKAENEPMDFSVVLTDIHGNRAVSTLCDSTILYPAFPVKLSKIQYITGKNEYKRQLQTVHITEKQFTEENGFDRSQIRSVRFAFDRIENGAVNMDNIAFVN